MAQAVLGKRLRIPADDVDRSIKKLGQSLWKYLIPDELKALYASERATWTDKTLLIQSDEPPLLSDGPMMRPISGGTTFPGAARST